MNAVGVDVNTASVPLLARVSGIAEGLAESIVAHRDENGPFRGRSGLHEGGPARAPRLSSSARASCGSPMATTRSTPPRCIRRRTRWCGASSSRPARASRNSSATPRPCAALKPAEFVDDSSACPTVTDIIAELEKPGRDPRPEFKTATFAAGIEKVADLKPGMTLEGVVTNVAAFGAFVDVGVHQDGLVHVSAMSQNFVKDPHEVVKSGDVVTGQGAGGGRGPQPDLADAAPRRRGRRRERG